MKNLAIFASGNGSNAQNIIEHFNKSNTARVSLIICNKPNAYVLERGKAKGVSSVVMTKEELTSDSPDTLISLLQENEINYIILAGYLLKIPEALVAAYPGSIINIHPALLPKFGGKGMYGHHVHEAVIAAGEKETGITIHLVDSNYDSGKILFQAKCDVLGSDTTESIEKKIHTLEQRHFPTEIERYIKANK